MQLPDQASSTTWILSSGYRSHFFKIDESQARSLYSGMVDITPDYVLSREAPSDGYYCPLDANVYGIEFLRFEIKDFDTGRAVYQVCAAPMPRVL